MGVVDMYKSKAVFLNALSLVAIFLYTDFSVALKIKSSHGPTSASLALKSQENLSSQAYNSLGLSMQRDMRALQLDRLMKPIELTSSGIESFITDIFNHPIYASDVLPFYCSHIEQLLLLAHEKKSALFARSVLKLFTQKINGCFCLNAYEYEKLLKELPTYLGDFCIPHEDKAQFWSLFKQTIKQLFFTAFLEQFSFFQEKPADFLDELAQKAAELAKTQVDNKNNEKLNYAIIRFIENSFHKLMWSPRDQEQAWHCFARLLFDLEQLYKLRIIEDTDDLDDLCWSLIHRFTYFLQSMGSHLSPSFFEVAHKDVTERKLLIFALEEQEAFMETKAQHLIRALMGAQAQARGTQFRR